MHLCQKRLIEAAIPEWVHICLGLMHCTHVDGTHVITDGIIYDTSSFIEKWWHVMAVLISDDIFLLDRHRDAHIQGLSLPGPDLKKGNRELRERKKILVWKPQQQPYPRSNWYSNKLESASLSIVSSIVCFQRTGSGMYLDHHGVLRST